jgi:hypothetical protein
MQTPRLLVPLLAMSIALAGCSGTTKSPDVSDGIRKSLDQAGLTSSAACQKKRQGEIVAPRIATSTARNPREHSRRGTNVTASAFLQSTWA